MPRPAGERREATVSALVMPALPPPRNKPLLLAVAASLLAHLILAATLLDGLRENAAAPPLHVSLATPPAPQAASPQPPTAVAEPAELPPVLTREYPAPSALPAPLPSPASPAPAAPAVADSGPPSQPATPPAAVPPRLTAPASAPDLRGALRSYRDQVEQEIRSSAIGSPRLARQRGWQGTALVRFIVIDGRLDRTQIVVSSGYDILDEQALRIVQEATLPPLPAALRGHTLALEVPISFTLKDKDAP